MIVPIILAAGESSRMGMLKPLVEIDGETFLQRLIKILRSSKVGKITVVLGNRAEEIAEYVDLSECTIVINPEYKNGQLSSLRKAILSLPEEGVDGILVCLVDHPYISTHLVDQLIDAFYASKKEIVVPVYGKKRGHPVIFSNKMFSHILAASLEVGAREVLWNNPDKVLELNVNEPGVLKDIDYPEDIE
jgi:molybdenum cofactor cytidylyltransferase